MLANVQEWGCFSTFRRADDVTRTMSNGCVRHLLKAISRLLGQTRVSNSTPVKSGLIPAVGEMMSDGSLKGIYTPAGSLTFSNSGLPDHHSPTL